jgi:hypothetical protein
VALPSRDSTFERRGEASGRRRFERQLNPEGVGRLRFELQLNLEGVRRLRFELQLNLEGVGRLLVSCNSTWRVSGSDWLSFDST